MSLIEACLFKLQSAKPTARSIAFGLPIHISMAMSHMGSSDPDLVDGRQNYTYPGVFAPCTPCWMRVGQYRRLRSGLAGRVQGRVGGCIKTRRYHSTAYCNFDRWPQLVAGSLGLSVSRSVDRAGKPLAGVRACHGGRLAGWLVGWFVRSPHLFEQRNID